ncbi:MAG: hypothetical protein RL701_381 [Pseudomonadota bacterium]|jgi:predicted component of type VI protein secretion system
MLPLVIQIERIDERTADTCAFAKSPIRIGRNPLSDLQLDESFVSQWHGVIRFDEVRTMYVDLGSTNPTLIDGQPIQRNVEVAVTETSDIRIGTLRLHVLRVAAPPELFGARRKSSFASENASGMQSNNIDATVFLGNAAPRQEPKRAPEPAPPQQARRETSPVEVGRQQHPPSQRDPVQALLQPAQPKSAPVQAPPLRPQPVAQQAEPARPSNRPPAGIAAAGDLVGLHRDYKASRDRLLAEVRQRLLAAQGQARENLFEQLMRDHPELSNEPEFRTLLGQLGISAWRCGVPDISDWLRRLTEGLYPPPGLAGQANLALAMERIGEILEVFSAAFIEMRVAHEKFASELALEDPVHDTLLNTSTNPRAVLAYLLNPTAENGSRVSDLQRAMADFAVHQVALVDAVVQGARDVLAELAPDTLTGRDKAGASFFGKLLGNDQKDLWMRYVKTFDDLLDADRFTLKLFGKGFARKYYAITGGRRSAEPAPRRRSESLKP